MRAAWVTGMVIGIVACHRAPDVKPWPARDLGDYSYRISGTPVFGKFTILADTVTLEAQQHSCRQIMTAVVIPVVYHFRCVGGSAVYNVAINPSSPLLS